MIQNYTMILSDVVAIKEERGKMYEHEPRYIVPLRALEGMCAVKAIRAFEALSTDKKLDEYRDLINYCVFVIERIQMEIAEEKLKYGDIKDDIE